MNEADDTTTIKTETSTLLRTLGEMERNAYVTKNPLFIWNAIAQCAEHDLPIPDYALDYIKDVAAALSPFIREAILKDEKDKIEPKEISKRVLDALQINTAKGRPNAFENMRRHLDDEMALLNEPTREVGRQPQYKRLDDKMAADRRLSRKLKRAADLRGATKPTPKP